MGDSHYIQCMFSKETKRYNIINNIAVCHSCPLFAKYFYYSTQLTYV